MYAILNTQLNIVAYHENMSCSFPDEMTRETAMKKMISFLKTFSVTYLSILSETIEKDEERAINQVFFHEIESVVRENLEKFQTDFPYLIVQIEKCV